MSTPASAPCQRGVVIFQAGPGEHVLLRPPVRKDAGQLGRRADAIKNTFDKLGIPEAERKFLAGVGAQYEWNGLSLDS